MAIAHLFLPKAKKRYIKIDWTAGTAHPFEDGHVGLVNDGYRVGTWWANSEHLTVPIDVTNRSPQPFQNYKDG